MIDIYDSETIVKGYRLLSKKCEAIDRFIKNHALYFGPCTEEYGSLDVCNNILDLMERKNKLINFKLIVDNAISKLDEKDKKILFIKINYNISMNELCGILDIKERTAFRRIERAFYNLAESINKSKFLNKLENIMSCEDWLINMKEDVKTRRLAFKQEEVNSL